MKIDYRTARMQTHRRNIQRYGRLLATELTDLERKYLHRRIAEEQAELERLAQAEHWALSARRAPSAHDPTYDDIAGQGSVSIGAICAPLLLGVLMRWIGFLRAM